MVWMSLAAVLAIAIGFGLVTMVQEMLAGGARMARIESVEGTLYRVAGDSSRAIGAGETIDEGEEVRTAKGSTAMVRMADGSLIEMSERAGFSLDASRKGNTIQLERGRIIVKAAKQRNRHLYVATRDAEVSVVGTIFAVNSGTKGSRVSVVEGEVHVQQGKKDSVLHPGDQMTTHASVERVPVKNEVAWSRNAKQYDQLLAELTALGRDIDARVERPGLRYSTRLLDLAPAGTTVWIALPNLSKSLAQTQQILDERISESPSLAQWWTETLRSTGNERKFHEMIEKLGALGQNLGDEVAVAMNAGGERRRRQVLAGAARRGDQRGVLPGHGGPGDRRAHPRQEVDPDRRRSGDRPRGGRDAALDPRRPAGGLAERRRAAQGGRPDRGGCQSVQGDPLLRPDRPGLPGRRRLAVRGRPPLAGGQGAGREDPGGAADGREAGRARPRPVHHRPPGDRRPGRDPRRPHLRPDAARAGRLAGGSGADGLPELLLARTQTSCRLSS